MPQVIPTLLSPFRLLLVIIDLEGSNWHCSVQNSSTWSRSTGPGWAVRTSTGGCSSPPPSSSSRRWTTTVGKTEQKSFPERHPIKSVLRSFRSIRVFSVGHVDTETVFFGGCDFFRFRCHAGGQLLLLEDHEWPLSGFCLSSFRSSWIEIWRKRKRGGARAVPFYDSTIVRFLLMGHSFDLTL